MTRKTKRAKNSGKEYSVDDVKYMLSFMITPAKLKGIARRLERTELEVKTFLQCMMGDLKRDARGWPKADRAARQAKVVRVACGRAQREWFKLRQRYEQEYDAAHPGNDAPAKHKWDYAAKIESEGSLRLIKEEQS